MTWAMRLNGADLIADGEGVHHVHDGAGFTVAVLSEGTQFGNFESLTEVLNTLMTAGAYERAGRVGNREPSLAIQITGDDADGLNAGEVWLSGLMGPGTLEWLPPGQSVWTVFDLTHAVIGRTYDERWDTDETVLKRRYAVPIKALPYARSRDTIVTPATDPAFLATLATGSSAAEWQRLTTDRGEAVTVSGTYTRLSLTTTPTDPGGRGEFAIVASLPARAVYLRMVWRKGTDTADPIIRVAGESTPPIQTTAASGWTTTHYFIPNRARGGSPVVVRVGTSSLMTAGLKTVDVDEFVALDAINESITGRQKVRAIVPGGSAPTDGTLHMAGAAALGDVLIHTYPLGRPSPALMQWGPQAGTNSADSLHGYFVALPTAFTVPSYAVAPRGGASLLAMLKATTLGAYTLRYKIESRDPSGGVITSVTSRDIAVTLGVGWSIERLGLPSLPLSTLGEGCSQRITVEKVTGTGTVHLAEAWTLGADEDCATTLLDTAVGSTPPRHVWLDSPSSEFPAGQVLVGAARESAYDPANPGDRAARHPFPPEGVSVLSVSALTSVETDLSHRRAWTHHAGT